MRWGLFLKGQWVIYSRAAGPKFLLVALSKRIWKSLFSDLWKTRNEEYVRCQPRFKSYSDLAVRYSNANELIVRRSGPDFLFTV